MNNDSLISSVARAVSSAVWRLHCKNSRFGTGYDVKVEDKDGGKEFTLLLMSGPARENNVIEELKASSIRPVGYGMIDDIAVDFENQLFCMT